MKKIIYIVILIGIFSQYSCDKCEEIVAEPCGGFVPNSEYCGWMVSTCYGGERSGGNLRINPDAPVAVIYNTSDNVNAPRGIDWGTSVQSIHPQKWISKEIGQVFGITMDNASNVYLGSSDIYVFDSGWNSIIVESGNLNRPFGCGQIFKCKPPSWDPLPFIDLPNSCDELNGIGNIAYDKWNHQLFASNLEDGKIYRIDIETETILETYDPWIFDNQASGIVVESERVWGVGVNKEAGKVKVYFARIENSNSRKLYSVELNNGLFPTEGSEIIEIVDLPNNQKDFYDETSQYLNVVISDIAFSSDSKKLIMSERGYPHNTLVYSYELNSSGVWSDFKSFNIGSQQAGIRPPDPYRQNSGGGVDFAPRGDISNPSIICDELIYSTMNYTVPRVQKEGGTFYYGIQGSLFTGNNTSYSAAPNANIDTDIFIDYNGIYKTGDKEIPGDVEIFDCSECEVPCSLNTFTN